MVTRSLMGRSARANGVVAPPANSVPARERGVRRRGWRLSLGGTVGLVLVAILLTVAVGGGLVWTVDPAAQDLTGRLQPPVGGGGDWRHPLGTDGLGHDILARLIAGARISLVVGVTATLVAGATGVLLGVVAGYAGGIAERLVSFATEVQLAVPFVVVAIAISATLGYGVGNVIAVLALTGWVGYARIVRLQTQVLRRAPFIDAARALGVGPVRMLTRHLLPNLAGPILVIASQQVAAMMLYEAALSYLGLGLPGDVVTWGGMVAAGRDALLNAWWVSTLPGVAIGMTILGFNLLGDWLRDAIDPETASAERMRGN